MCPSVLKFDASQQEAICHMLDTLESGSRKQFTLAGLAGSGKTSLIQEVLQQSSVTVGVGSLTGKACDVLRRKGISGAQTLHSLLYEFDPETRTFHPRADLPYHGVIVDEASMVNKELHADLTRHDVSIVWVGDHGQLEPIGESPNLMAKPDFTLERIYRQAEGSAILDVAHAFRQGLVPDWKAGKEVARLTNTEAMERILDFDVVLCGRNVTRANVNAFIRRKKGYALAVEEGETMVCLRNNRTHGVFNGMLLKVSKVHRGFGDASFILTLNEVGTDRTISQVRCRMMNGEEVPFGFDRDTIALDYGGCLTVSKAQGSEWDRVLVFEERGGWDMRRWRYTAATRAAKFLAWTR